MLFVHFQQRAPNCCCQNATIKIYNPGNLDVVEVKHSCSTRRSMKECRRMVPKELGGSPQGVVASCKALHFFTRSPQGQRPPSPRQRLQPLLEEEALPLQVLEVSCTMTLASSRLWSCSFKT